MNLDQNDYDLSFMEIMMKKEAWQVQQKDGQLFCFNQEVQNKYDITQFKTELWRLLYSTNQSLSQKARDDEKKYILHFIKFNELNFEPIQLSKNTQLMLMLETNENDFQCEITNPFLQQQFQYIKQGAVDKYYFANNTKSFYFQQKRFLQKFNFYQDQISEFENIQAKCIDITVRHYINCINNFVAKSHTFLFEFDKIKPKFDNISIKFIKFVDPFKNFDLKIQLHINKSLMKVKLDISNNVKYSEILIKFDNKKIIIQKLVIKFGLNIKVGKLKKLFQKKNQISEFQFKYPNFSKQLLNFDRGNELIFKIKLNNNNQNEALKQFKQLRGQLFQQKYQILLFQKLISEQLTYSPHQTLIDLYI